MLSNRLPHRHQLWNGDVTPDQIKNLVRTVESMESDAAPTRADVQRQFGAIIKDSAGRLYVRIGYIALANTPECITDKGTSGGELLLIIQVLELATTALV
jgi:hypothetical protein